MNDELTKPLGLKPQKTKGAIRPGFVALAVLVVAAAGFGAFRAFAPQPAITTAEAPIPPQPAPAKPQTTLEAPAAAAPDSAGPVDDGGPALAEVEPQGSIEQKEPIAEQRQEIGLAHLPDPALSERGEDGILPKRSADGLRPMDVYSRPPATEGNFGVARVVLIVGGMGISQTGSQQAIRQLPPSVTLAFAPYGNSLLRWMQEARRKGHELLLQVPMEPFGENPGPHTLSTAQDASTNLADLHWSMSRITNYVGIVNFLGGKFVTEPEALKPVFEDIATRGLLFVDDGTARNSVSAEVAKEALLPYARAAVQIDLVRNRASIAKQLNALAEEAKRTGVAIGMANAFPESIDAIAKFTAGANAAGIEITPVSAIVSDPERKR